MKYRFIRSHAADCRVKAVLVGMLLSVLSGCGPQAGAMLYFLGVGRTHMIDPEYELGEGPVLVLVDDVNEQLTYAQARDMLAEDLGEELIEKGAAKKVISPETVKRFRRTNPDFADIPCNKVGRMVGADQVVWVQVKSFFAQEEVHDTTKAATISTTVKVINPHERENRRKVCLWPPNREGKLVSVQLNSNEVSRLRTEANITAKLSEELAEEIAKLFYKHPFQEDDE